MKILRGTIIKRSGDKTVAVEVRRVVVHPIYQKRHTRAKTYLAHDLENRAEVGQDVSIREVRPMSKRKRWLVINSQPS
jgi:small subunit ribosomal protein S17